MLKYHVAVCDDEKSDLDGIVQSVQQYDVQGCFDIETYMDSSTEELAKRQEVQYTLHSFYFIVTVFLVIKPRAFDTVRALLDTAAIKPCIQAPVSIKFPRI